MNCRAGGKRNVSSMAASRSVPTPQAPGSRGALPSEAATLRTSPENSQAAASRGVACHAAVATLPAAPSVDEEYLAQGRKMKVLIAGAGIGGLVLGVSLLKKGVDVQLFERDMTAIRGEGKYRGPIQVRSSHNLPCCRSPSIAAKRWSAVVQQRLKRFRRARFVQLVASNTPTGTLWLAFQSYPRIA